MDQPEFVSRPRETGFENTVSKPATANAQSLSVASSPPRIRVTGQESAAAVAGVVMMLAPLAAAAWGANFGA